jgi:hypothetical protein
MERTGMWNTGGRGVTGWEWIFVAHGAGARARKRGAI